MKRNITKRLTRAAILVALFLTALPAAAQTTANGYLIYSDETGNFLAHDATTGTLSTTGVTDFDLATCLWTISSSNIRPVSSNGSTVLGNLYLRPRSRNNTYNLNTNTSTDYAAWNGGLTDGGRPYYGNYYMRITGTNTWQISATNSKRGTLYAVSKIISAVDEPEKYSGSISGTDAFFAAGATATYTPSASHTAAYSYTQTTYSYSGGELASSTSGTAPNPTNVNLASGWTLVWSLSDDTYATIDNSGTLTVKNTLPATYATTTVTLTASKNDGTASFTSSLPVTIYASLETHEYIMGGNQGIAGGVVTLNDYEDHTWSYYSDPTCPIRNLNPANVKITYYGNGTNTVATSNNADPGSTFTASTNNAVKVGIDADAHTFVYYKTLERVDGNLAASVSAVTGRCAYILIPNPFYVRPTYGTDATNKWRGFYAWRVKSVSNGKIYSAKSGGTEYTTNNIINAETEVFFEPDDEYGMTVEFEALWARAYVSTSGAGNNSVGVERNFYVMRTDATANITTAAYPCTYTSIYPNGTTDGTAAAALSDRKYRYGGFSAPADSKIEYIILRNNNSTVTGMGKNFTVGRGVSGYNNGLCASNLNTLGNTDINAALDYHARIESGSYGTTYLMTNDHISVASTVHVYLTFGSDYDRATNTNGLLSVASSNTLKFGQPYLPAVNKSYRVMDMTVKSGEFQSGYWSGNNNDGNYDHSFYCGCDFNDAFPGLRYVTIEGGEFSSINGGRGSNDASDVNTPDTVFILRYRGGHAHGAVYGSGAATISHGGRCFIFTGGTVEGWMAGGCNGTSNGAAHTDGDSYFYVGGNVTVGGSPQTINGTPGGNIFGAGRGNSGHGGSQSPGSITNSYIVVADNATVLKKEGELSGNIYGGGNYGYTTDDSHIYILGGTVQGSVFGGSNQNQTTSQGATITMTGGTVLGGIYGGSNTSGNLSTVDMHINGGQVGTSSANANIHGGGYGSDTRVTQNVDVTIGEAGQTEPGVTVYGDVYGGSAMGLVNGTSVNTTYHTNVTINACDVHGDIYGGGLGDNTNAANVYSPVTVTLNGGSVSGGIYGCNNVKGAPQSTVAVDVYGTDPAPSAGTYAIYQVFGGGNNADYSGTPAVKVHCTDANKDISVEEIYGGGNQAEVAATNVTIEAGNIIGDVYGGGRQADVNGNTVVNVNGGTVRRVFGGNNMSGTIGGTISVTANKTTACPMMIGELYGGGNEAASQAGSITIGCTGDITADHLAVGADAGATPPSAIGHTLEGIGDVYGGANNALVTGDITLDINSGMIYRVFGGNNTGNTVSGDITVNVAQGAATCGWYVGYVYGGGNNAAYSNAGNAFPAVNHSAGKVTYNVYGGGKGSTAIVTSNPKVILSGTAQVGGNVFGGGNAAPVVGNPTVLLKD